MKDDPVEISRKRRRKARKAPNLVSDDYLARLLCPPINAGEDLGFLRSAIVIGLITETGIRLKELSRLKRCDIDIPGGEISIWSWNSSLTYGSKREAPISDTLTQRIRQSFGLSGFDKSPMVPNIPEEPDRASLSLQREIRNAQLRAGLTARLCGIEKRDPNAPPSASATLERPRWKPGYNVTFQVIRWPCFLDGSSRGSSNR
jgi:integrase